MFPDVIVEQSQDSGEGTESTKSLDLGDETLVRLSVYLARVDLLLRAAFRPVSACSTRHTLPLPPWPIRSKRRQGPSLRSVILSVWRVDPPSSGEPDGCPILSPSLWDEGPAGGIRSRVDLFEQIRRDHDREELSNLDLARRHGVHRTDGAPSAQLAAAADEEAPGEAAGRSPSSVRHRALIGS